MTAAVQSGLSYADLRRRAAELLLGRGEWAGCPIPIDGLSLHIEPSYPYQGLATAAAPDDDDSLLDKSGLLPGERLVNTWYSRRREAYVFVIQNAEGRGFVFSLPEKRSSRRLDLSIESMKAAWAHDTEADMTAMCTLSEHVSEEKMRQYLLLGQFLETSKRSGVTYVFRRARPTIALRATSGGSYILAVLCLHPIAYYGGTFVGAMTPTDDVIAHLMLMRGDEPMFWRRANQHNPEHPEAGL